MKGRFGVIMQIFRVSFLFSSVGLLTITGCMHPPVLLRNRPNVPPPIVEPVDGAPIMSVGQNTPPANITDIGMTEPAPVRIITIPKPVSVPEIETNPITYRVKKGDSFWGIARMYGVTKEEIATCNNLSLNKPLRVGTSLLIPPGGEFIPENKRPKIKKSATKRQHSAPPVTRKTVEYTPGLNDGKYTVQRGDSLWKISRRFHITTSQLMQANNLGSKDVLHVGKTLIIPGAGTKTTTTAPQHVVKPVTTTETKTKISDEQISTENEADQLLKDAETATKEVVQQITETLTGDTPDEGLTDLDKATEIADSETAGSLYTEEVLPNETLQDIADRHGMTPEDIRAVNPGLPADGKLKPFTSIKIPNQ